MRAKRARDGLSREPVSPRTRTSSCTPTDWSRRPARRNVPSVPPPTEQSPARPADRFQTDLVARRSPRYSVMEALTPRLDAAGLANVDGGERLSLLTPPRDGWWRPSRELLRGIPVARTMPRTRRGMRAMVTTGRSRRVGRRPRGRSRVGRFRTLDPRSWSCSRSSCLCTQGSCHGGPDARWVSRSSGRGARACRSPGCARRARWPATPPPSEAKTTTGTPNRGAQRMRSGW